MEYHNSQPKQESSTVSSDLEPNPTDYIVGVPLEDYSEISNRTEENAKNIKSIEKRLKQTEEGIKNIKSRELQVVPVQFLETEKLILKQPIWVSLIYSSEDKAWIVDCPELNLYGEGRDEQGARGDFKTALEEFYLSLKEDKEKLSPDLKEKWNILERIIQEK